MRRATRLKGCSQYPLPGSNLRNAEVASASTSELAIASPRIGLRVGVELTCPGLEMSIYEPTIARASSPWTAPNDIAGVLHFSTGKLLVMQGPESVLETYDCPAWHAQAQEHDKASYLLGGSQLLATYS